jgi:hypothetical protein
MMERCFPVLTVGPLAHVRRLYQDAAARLVMGVTRDALPLLRRIYGQYLGSFEDAVTHALGDDFAWFAPFAQRVGFVVPSVLPPPEKRATLYRAVLARLVAAHAAERWLAHTDGERYATHLFADTHLDWLATAVRYGEVLDDAFWLSHDGHVLTRTWPLPNRVRCIEELPNLAPHLLHANLFMEPGGTAASESAVKATGSLMQDLAHALLKKALPNICHVRHVVTMLERATEAHAMIGDLVLLILHVVLAGNLPRTHQRASLALRLRLQLAFVPDPVANRAPVTTVANVWAWASLDKLHKQALLSLVQEHFAYVCEGEGVVDEVLASRIKWRDFKSTVRFTNGRLREELDRCMREDGFWAPFPWITGGPFAEIMTEGHTLGLSTCFKNFKGRMGAVVSKKMVAVAAFLVVVYATRELDGLRLARVLAILYGFPAVDSMTELVERVYMAPIDELGPRALPARINVIASAAEALVHGYECAIYYRTKLSKVHKTPHERLPFDKQGPDDFQQRLHDAMVYAGDAGHPELAATLAEEDCNPFVALCLYVAQRTFLPSIRDVLRRLTEPMEFCAWYSARAANSPTATPRQREVMQLKWLQAFGLPREDCETIREWGYRCVLLVMGDPDAPLATSRTVTRTMTTGGVRSSLAGATSSPIALSCASSAAKSTTAKRWPTTFALPTRRHASSLRCVGA